MSGDVWEESELECRGSREYENSMISQFANTCSGETIEQKRPNFDLRTKHTTYLAWCRGYSGRGAWSLCSRLIYILVDGFSAQVVQSGESGHQFIVREVAVCQNKTIHVWNNMFAHGDYSTFIEIIDHRSSCVWKRFRRCQWCFVKDNITSTDWCRGSKVQRRARHDFGHIEENLCKPS